MNWTNYLISIAEAVAKKSKDPNTQVGAVISDPATHRILCTGYNGFPAGVSDVPERWTRPLKYKYVCHAEANAISTAARFGVRIDGSDLFVTLEPCNECSKIIASSGIRRVFFKPGTSSNGAWRENSMEALDILRESGIEFIPVHSGQSEIGDVK